MTGKKKSVNLIKILSKKSHFFAFVQHLAYELSVENLTFLVELWQFKNEEKYDLTSEQKDMHKLELAQESSRKWSKGSNTENSKSTDGSSDHDAASPVAPDAPQSPGNTSLPQSPEHSQHTVSSAAYHMAGGFIRRMTSLDQIGGQNKFMANKFLDKLPWCDLPLAQSVSRHPMDKWEQCREIYLKFIQDSSYYAINIGYDATNEINAKYEQLWQYKRQGGKSKEEPKDLTVEMTKDNNTTITAFDRESGDIELSMPKFKELSVPDMSIDDDAIVNDEQFNSIMMELFDVAMRDILNNLKNSLNRFINTDTFKMLN